MRKCKVKFLALKSLLAAILALSFFVSLVACSDKSGESETVGGSGESETESLREGYFSIFSDGEYLVNVIYPERASEAEKAVYKRIKTGLAELTGVTPQRVTDFKAYNDDGSSRLAPAILIGNTNYDESKKVYGELAYTESRIESVGNKLVLAFNTGTDTETLCDMFFEKLLTESNTYVGMPENVSAFYYADETFARVPRYPNAGHTVTDLDNGTYMLYSATATEAEVAAYCETLKSVGFVATVYRDEGGNIFNTLVSDDKYAYVYFSGYNSSARAVIGPRDMLAATEYDTDAEETYTPYIASIPQPEAGEGYIIRLEDGRFIIFDGGYKGEDRVYTTLRELEEGSITVAAWFISHPHGDHFPAFIDFIEAHGSDTDITVESVMFNYASPEYYNIKGSAGEDNSGDSVKLLYDSIKKYIPDTPVIKVHTGQVIGFGSASVEILYTVEDLLPRKMTNVNDSSLVARVNVGGNSIMFLNDTCYASGPILNMLWGEGLKSDIVQMAHHGMWPSVKEIYDSIKAEVILFPSVLKALKYHLFDGRWIEVTNAALGYAKDIYASGDTLQIIELPYSFKNNKREMLDYIKNYVPAS